MIVIKRLIKHELTDTDLSCKQANVSRGAFCYRHDLELKCCSNSVCIIL